MMKKYVLLCVMLGFYRVVAAADLQGIPEDYQYCTVCHGTMLHGNESTAAPAIAGLPAWYVQQELKAFSMDWRGSSYQDFTGAEMHTVAKNIAPESVAPLAEFVSQLPPSRVPQTISGDVAAGQQHFHACAACHGMDAGGNAVLGAPPLLVQSDWYLKSQLKKFHQGTRGFAEQDEKGQLMAAAVATLSSETDIDNLIAYINSLK